MLDVVLLGTGGMMPLPNRYLSSVLCRFNGSGLLIDCGEGTQVTMKMTGWGFKNIDLICFTHFHADHISGLPGLLLTIGNSREETLTILGPPGIGKVVRALLTIASDLPFEIDVIELPYNKGQSHEINKSYYTIRSFGLDHRIPCLAYCIEVKRAGRFDNEKAQYFGVPMRAWSRLQKNEEVEIDGIVYKPEMVLGPPRKSIKLSYCTDTKPLNGISGFVENSDLFVCEGLYGDDDQTEKAHNHRHMVFSEAAGIASEAGVNELWLTHFSPSLVNPKDYQHIAKSVFANTKIGYDRMKSTLCYTD